MGGTEGIVGFGRILGLGRIVGLGRKLV